MSVLQHLLRRAGLAVFKSTHPGLRYLDHAAYEPFDQLLLRTFPDLEGLSFVQIGANDSQLEDPIARYLDRCRWRGVMLEPMPRNFAALQRRRGANPRVVLLPAALDEKNGRRAIHDLDPAIRSGLPAWTQGLASFSRERLEQVCRELDLPATAIQTRDVDTVTWDDVRRHLDGRPCDLLVTDTEGFDIPLLRTADLGTWRPRMIAFEHACHSLDERMAFYRELLEIGYDLTTHRGDTFAVLARRP